MIINRNAFSPSLRKVQIDPLRLEAKTWVNLDGWYAALGWPMDTSIRVADNEIPQWGDVMEIDFGWNPKISPNTGQSRLTRGNFAALLAKDNVK